MRSTRHRDHPRYIGMHLSPRQGEETREDGTWKNGRAVPWGGTSRESWHSPERPETLLHVIPDRRPFLSFIPEVWPLRMKLDGFCETCSHRPRELKKTLRQAAPHRRQGDGADHGRPSKQRSACTLDLHPYDDTNPFALEAHCSN